MPRARAHPYARDPSVNTTSSSRSSASLQQSSSSPRRSSNIQPNSRNVHQVGNGGGTPTHVNSSSAANDGQNLLESNVLINLRVNIIPTPITAVEVDIPPPAASPNLLEVEQHAEMEDLPDETDSDDETTVNDVIAISSDDEGSDYDFNSQEAEPQPTDVNQALDDASLTAYDCSQPSDSQQPSYDHKCKVCDVHEIHSACMPCGHFSICQICYDRLDRFECPICRGPITEFKPIYF